MFALYAKGLNRDDPLSVLGVGQIATPATPSDWVTVQVRAAALNHHDIWALKGQALGPDRLPMVLGTDAAGITDDSTEVIVHAVIGDPEAGRGDETLDPKRTMLSELHPGTLAEQVRVPRRNLLVKPEQLSFEQACCLPTAYLTAYRMIATKSATVPGETILVQGAGGGVATALILLGRALGRRVWVTSRDPEKLKWALELGADDAFPSGTRLPEPVDAVMETVGAATWGHSLRSLRPGGCIVVSGATSGPNPPADLNRVFFRQLAVVGSTMGTIGELSALVDLMLATGIRPIIQDVRPLSEGRESLAVLDAGDVRGKLVLVPER